MLITPCLLGLSIARFANASPLPVCIDYHCDEIVMVELTPEQLAQVKSLFKNVRDADAERQQIRRAIALLETRVGEHTVTNVDLGRNPSRVANEPGQLDCIAESKNTTTYLKLLASLDLLQWHTVEARKHRVKWIFNNHWTAVIKDTDTNIQYAVDSWFLDNGEMPYIQELQAWVKWKDFK